MILPSSVINSLSNCARQKSLSFGYYNEIRVWGGDSVFLFFGRFGEAPDNARGVTDGCWKVGHCSAID